jgi:hypothetical protein
VRSRPIYNYIGYPTGQVSHFLHRRLIDAVKAHTHVLKDSLSLIRQLESMSFLPEQNILLTSADVAALYPWINIEDGIKALQWFMAQHSSIPQDLQPKYLKLPRFALGNKYVAVLYSHLRNRGYPSKAIHSTFRTVTWNQRSKMLELKKRGAFVCSVPRLRLLQQKCAGECGAADGDGPLARGAARARPGASSPDIFTPRDFCAIYLRSQWG